MPLTAGPSRQGTSPSCTLLAPPAQDWDLRGLGWARGGPGGLQQQHSAGTGGWPRAPTSLAHFSFSFWSVCVSVSLRLSVLRVVPSSCVLSVPCWCPSSVSYMFQPRCRGPGSTPAPLPLLQPPAPSDPSHHRRGTNQPRATHPPVTSLWGTTQLPAGPQPHLKPPLAPSLQPPQPNHSTPNPPGS